MLLEITVPVASEVVSLQEIKDQQRIDVADEDNLLRGLITTAREKCEAMLDRTISACTYKLSIEAFDQTGPIDRFLFYRYSDYGDCSRARCYEGRSRSIRLMKPPLTAVTSIQYIDEAGQTQTLSNSVYNVDKDEPGFVRLASGQSWPSLGSGHYRVFITYTAGYTPSTCPASIKHAIKLLVGHYFENREATGDAKGEIPFGVESLLSTNRWSIG